MSTKRGPGHLHRARRRRVADLGWCMAFAAVASADELPSGRQGSHDMVIKLAGGHRRSGVEWLEYPASAAPELFGKLTAEKGSLERYQGYLDFLAEHPDGFLVLARVRATKMASTLP